MAEKQAENDHQTHMLYYRMEAFGLRALSEALSRFFAEIEIMGFIAFLDYFVGPDGISYETVEIPKPEGEFIVLEILNKETNNIESPLFYGGTFNFGFFDQSDTNHQYGDEKHNKNRKFTVFCIF